jgi:hypothetical protein
LAVITKPNPLAALGGVSKPKDCGAKHHSKIPCSEINMGNFSSLLKKNVEKVIANKV